MGHGHGNWRCYRNAPPTDWGMGPGYGPMGDHPPPFRGPVSWLAVLVSLVVWFGVAYVGYLALDVTLSWLAANSGAALQSGKDAGDALGVGKQVGVAVERLKGAGLIDQGLSLLRTILMPTAIVIWAPGALLIVVLPRLLGVIAGGFWCVDTECCAVVNEGQSRDTKRYGTEA